MSCLVCGYLKHTDACHIKDIKDFKDDDKISEINHPKNIIPLCKNHHWEFDHNKIEKADLDTIKSYLSQL